jgi:hypothetical protein
VSTLGELLYALVEPVPDDAGEVYSLVAGGSLFELYGMDGHADCGLSVYCRNPLHPGPCKGWKKHLGATAPGVLAALEKVRHQKLAESRAKRAAAKSEAEKIVHGKLGMGSHPLHQKQLTVKHAKTILTGDENKAVNQASKVILNKAEIKRYSKLKAAQIAENGGQWAGVQDKAGFAKNLEQQIANALVLDNKDNSTSHLTDLLGGHADALSAQFVNRLLPKCAKGDHDCDGVAYEKLKDHLATSLFRGLRDGNMDEANRQADEVKALGGDPEKIRAWLAKEGVDLKGGSPEMTVHEPVKAPAKVGSAVHTTLKAAGLKPGDKVYLHVVTHDGQKHAATVSDAKSASTHSILATVDAPQGGKAVFHDDATGEKIAGGSAAKKYLLTEAEGHPLTKPEPVKPKTATKPVIKTEVMHEVKPNDLTPNEAKPAGPPPAAEWVQPGKFDGWLPSQEIKNIIVGAKTPSTDAEAKAWADSVSKIPKSQWDNLVPAVQDDITAGLAEEHKLWLHADPAHAAKIEETHKKLTGLGLTVGQGMPDVSESPSSGPAPGEPNPIEHLLDLGVQSNTVLMKSLQENPKAYDSLPDYHKEKLKGVLQAKHLLGTPEEKSAAQSLAALHKIDLASSVEKAYPAEPTALGTPKSETLTKLLEYAKPKAEGGKWALAKTKLPMYQELSDQELADLTPEEKDLLKKDLSAMVIKLKDPKKIAAVAAIQNKISKAHGGGAGAGGTSHVETPGHVEMSTLDPGTKIAVQNSVDKMNAVVSKITGVDIPESITQAVTGKIGELIAQGDDSKLHAALLGPAQSISQALVKNNPHLEPHQPDITAALQDDLLHVMKNDFSDTPVLDAVNKWGTTKVLPANAAAKIVDALKNHPSQQGIAGHAVPDSVLGNELAKHAGEAALPPLYDPGDYQAVSGWLATHALGNSMANAGIDANDLYDSAGDIALTLHDEAKQKAQADYLQALFDGKTKPSGFAAELATIAESVKSKGDKQAAKSGWAPGSAALQAWKSGMYYTELKKALEGTGAGSGGPATSTTPAEVKKVVAEAATPGGLTDVHKIMLKEAYKSFGSTAYLKESTVEQNFDNLLAVAKVYSGQEGIPELTFGKVMDAVDEQMASDLGVVNGQLLRKKITDWLATPAGKNYVDSVTAKTQLVSHLTGKIAEQKEAAEWAKKMALPKYPGPGKFDPAKPDSDFKNLTTAQGLELHNATLKKLGKKITPEQKSALVSYSGSGASYMNSYLRTGKGDKSTIKEAHLVDEAMYPIPEDLRVARRTGWEFVPPQYRSAEAIQKLIGGTFKDPAFMSTTYFETPGGYGKGLPVVLDMQIPKGTRGFHLDHWSHFKGTENEWLLAAGQTLQIMDVQVITDYHKTLNPTGGKRVVVKVRVVNGDDE